jgi:hypothetical protein
VLVDYIKGMCDLLYSQVRKQIFSEESSTKVETKHGVPTVYEQNIVELEAQIRQHYSIQNQLKLHIEITDGEHEEAIKKLTTEVSNKDSLLKKASEEIRRCEKLL